MTGGQVGRLMVYGDRLSEQRACVGSLSVDAVSVKRPVTPELAGEGDTQISGACWPTVGYSRFQEKP